MPATPIPMTAGAPTSRVRRAHDRLDAATRRMLGASPERITQGLIGAAALAVANPDPTSLVLGAAISLTGELVRIITAGYGYRVGELSVRGPYRFVRHPYFLGTALYHLGIWLAARQPWVMAAGIVAIALIYRRRIARDEDKLARLLGPRFIEYKLEVPAFLPRLWPTHAQTDDGRGFSLRLALLTGRHRELDALLVLAAGFGLLSLSYVLAAKELFGLTVVVTVSVFTVGRLIYMRRSAHKRPR